MPASQDCFFSKGLTVPKNLEYPGAILAENQRNVLTIASTVLDFVPGLEWAGALGGIVATGLNVAGDRKDHSVEEQQDLDAQKNVDAPAEQVMKLSQRGGITQAAQDASHQIMGSSTF